MRQKKIFPNYENIAKYSRRWSRLTSHMDWFLQFALMDTAQTEWTLDEVRGALHKASDIRPNSATILKYNLTQFEKHQTAPLERVGPGVFRLNDDYYRVLGDEVRPPGQLGRPRKYPYDENGRPIMPRRQRPESRTYQGWYHRLIRSPENTPLTELFNDDGLIDTSTVQQFLHEKTSVKFGQKAVHTFLQRYVDNGRGPPYLREAEAGAYRRVSEPPK